MTRMWDVDPELMCRQHLLGEHREMHFIVGSIEKHPHGEAIARGHGEKGQLDTSLIQERHDALVAEMEARGYNHDSPMDYVDDLGAGEISAERDPSVETETIRDELMRRCPDCRERMEE